VFADEPREHAEHEDRETDQEVDKRKPLSCRERSRKRGDKRGEPVDASDLAVSPKFFV
jgi:hypothetical protein